VDNTANRKHPGPCQYLHQASMNYVHTNGELKCLIVYSTRDLSQDYRESNQVSAKL